jgi:hypothetical protein
LTGVQAGDCKLLNQISGMTISVKWWKVDSLNFWTKFGVYKDVLLKDKLCVRIVVSGLISAGWPCSWLLVEIRCRLTRQGVSERESLNELF